MSNDLYWFFISFYTQKWSNLVAIITETSLKIMKKNIFRKLIQIFNFEIPIFTSSDPYAYIWLYFGLPTFPYSTKSSCEVRADILFKKYIIHILKKSVKLLRIYLKFRILCARKISSSLYNCVLPLDSEPGFPNEQTTQAVRKSEIQK